MDVSLIPSWDVISVLGVVTAVLAYGLTYIAKAFLSGWEKAMAEKAPWFWNGIIRLLSVLLGAVSGAGLLAAIGGLWTWGAAIGCGGGALSTTIVAVVKKRIRAREAA